LKDITFRNDDIADRSEMAEREAEANEDNNDVSVRGDGHEMEGNLPRLNRWLITDALLHNLDERIFKNLHITRLEHPREYRYPF
jgi:hypothetical protein